ncbi:MAG TPA: hypothetical protein VMV10_32110 [Pirellulales bacterium]|nr:hypothetical protein [Pirellulales bacterium]
MTNARVFCLAVGFLLAAAVGLSPPPLHAEKRETIENSIGMRLVAIPAGEFMMGAEGTED